ncbi:MULTISPECIES: restriction endonuclease subunit S [unclassified Bradyrhizobium]|uniref:restriction endonuclease subunit S n=1 Tax=unclassified Bradyrhizobium TaxID=2631580 RepID=UPI00339AB9EE
MKAWPLVRLGELIVEAAYGTSVKCSERAEGVPVLRMGNVRYDGTLDLSDLKYASLTDAELAKFGIQEDDVLFNRTNSKELVGKTGLWDGRFPAAAASYFIRVRVARDVVCPKWVWRFMNSAAMKHHLFTTARGAIGQANINSEELKSFLLPLPPLQEQRRILALLDQAAEIKRRTEAARAKARSIIPALFMNTFGDPATNPKGWPVQFLAELADIGSGLTKGKKLNGMPIVPTPYLRVANVQADRLDLSEIKLINATEDDRKRCRLEVGDLLMTEGGDIDKLGRCAMWRGEVDLCLHQNHVFRVRMGKAVNPDYARAFMQSEAARGYFLRVAKRTTGIASINKTQLGRLPVWVPPMSLQFDFAAQVERIEASARVLDGAAANAHVMEAALTAEVFGDLSNIRPDKQPMAAE